MTAPGFIGEGATTEDEVLTSVNTELQMILVCVYCGNDVADERTPCCGEIHNEWVQYE